MRGRANSMSRSALLRVRDAALAAVLMLLLVLEQSVRLFVELAVPGGIRARPTVVTPAKAGVSGRKGAGGYSPRDPGFRRDDA